jgi:hypothetical protein
VGEASQPLDATLRAFARIEGNTTTVAASVVALEVRDEVVHLPVDIAYLVGLVDGLVLFGGLLYDLVGLFGYLDGGVLQFHQQGLSLAGHLVVVASLFVDIFGDGMLTVGAGVSICRRVPCPEL